MKFFNHNHNKQLRPGIGQAGFTLVEALAALVIATVMIGFSLPAFLYQHIQNINSDIKTGAVAVSQQILESLETADVSLMPMPNSFGTPVTVSFNANLTSGSQNLLTVDSVQGFAVGQSLIVGSDPNSYVIQSINNSTNTITLTSSLQQSASSGALVKHTALGYRYDVTLIYCGDPNLVCNSSSSRNILVQVNYNGKTVYTVETIYTKFQ